MASEREERNKADLTEKARLLFFAEGFARLSMEETASALGACKATIYKYFPNKDALVAAVVDLQIRDISRDLDALASSRLSFKERFIGFLRIIFGFVQPAARAFLRDVTECAPKEWKRIESFRRERVFPVLVSLLNEGAELGFMRRDLSAGAVAPMLVAMIDQIARPELLLELPLSLSEAVNALARIVLQGILSDSGRADFGETQDAIFGAKGNNGS